MIQTKLASDHIKIVSPHTSMHVIPKGKAFLCDDESIEYCDVNDVLLHEVYNIAGNFLGLVSELDHKNLMDNPVDKPLNKEEKK